MVVNSSSLCKYSLVRAVKDCQHVQCSNQKQQSPAPRLVAAVERELMKRHNGPLVSSSLALHTVAGDTPHQTRHP